MKKIVFTALAVLSVNAFSWSDKDLEVDYIDVKSNGNVSVYFKVAADVPNPKPCTHAGTISWEGSNPSADNFLSTFLAAKMANKKVQLQVDGESCLWGGWPNLQTVRVK